MAKADKSKKKSTAKKSVPKSSAKKQQTVRERTQVAANKQPRRVRQAASKLSSPLKKVRHHGKREVHIPLPDNRAGRVLGKRVRLVPRFVREAWREIRLVHWPNRRETIRLTIAVFVFSLVFAVIVGLIDFVLDKVFREVIIGR